MKTHFLVWSLVFALALSSCSIQVEQPNFATPDKTLGSIHPTSSSYENNQKKKNVTTTQVPVTWGDLNLTGRLVYINGTVVDNVFSLQIQVLNLVTGEVKTIFDAPKYSWIYYVTVSPNDKQVVMSYSPPPGDNPVDQDLYIMPLDGSQAPKLLFTPTTK